MEKIKLGFRMVKLYENYINIVLDLLVDGLELTHALRNGLRFRVRSGGKDLGVINEILIRNQYSQLLKMLKGRGSVVDVGGHIGIFSVLAGKKGCYVHTYEPDPDSFRLLEENISLNYLEDMVFPIQKAVSSVRGTKYLILDTNPAKNFIVNRVEKVEHLTNFHSVETVRLDDIMKGLKEPIFLKMDCEGTEYDILSSSNLDKVEAIQVECHDPSKNPALIRYLKEEGFRTSGEEIYGGIMMIFGKRI